MAIDPGTIAIIMASIIAAERIFQRIHTSKCWGVKLDMNDPVPVQADADVLSELDVKPDTPPATKATKIDWIKIPIYDTKLASAPVLTYT